MALTELALQAVLSGPAARGIAPAGIREDGEFLSLSVAALAFARKPPRL